MARRGADRVPGPPEGLPACKVIALRLARSARPGGPSASDTSTSSTRLHRLHADRGAGDRRGPATQGLGQLRPRRGQLLAEALRTVRVCGAGLVIVRADSAYYVHEVVAA